MVSLVQIHMYTQVKLSMPIYSCIRSEQKPQSRRTLKIKARIDKLSENAIFETLTSGT
jgi:hypothetical protein